MRTLVYGLLTCLGRRTITGVLCSAGQQFEDWSSAYRLFEMARLDTDAVWRILIAQAAARTDPAMPLIGVIDDTAMRKDGKKVHGTGRRRDAQGPPFNTNLVWAQCAVEAALILLENGWASPARSLAVDVLDVPRPARPRKDAAPEQVAACRHAREANTLGAVGVRCIRHLRDNLDRCPQSRGRKLVVCVDGGYTNRTMFGAIPADTTLIGRVRADAAIFATPASQPPTGRRRIYGEKLPTPEQLKRDDAIPWVYVDAYATGRIRHFAVKTLAPIRWKPAEAKDLRLLVIRELRYRKTSRSRLEHRAPVYLIDADRNAKTGWFGSDYVVNRTVVDSKTTTLMRYVGTWPDGKWVAVARLPMRYAGNKLELSIPRKLLGLAGSSMTFDFKWADNPAELKDAISLCTDGDTAPNRRFNYRAVWRK